MRFNKLSKKQKQIFKWCHGKNKDKYDAIICDGAIRSGKTVCMSCSFILWIMRYFNNSYFAICGKTVQSAERNIVNPLLDMEDLKDYYEITYKRADKCLTVTDGKKTNYIYVFGGRDESSSALILGMTLGGVLLDEVAVMPRSFVEQAIARCSVKGSKFWFNCNPDSPRHWFKEEWIDKAEEKNALHLHFNITDNPVLERKIIERYMKLYTGVFYQRFILGLWVAADGLVYDINTDDLIVQPDELPLNGRYYISVDYGTLNPFSAGLWCVSGGKAYRVKEFYYDGRKKGKQLTDEEYYQELIKLADGYRVDRIIIDPSAASMIATIKRHGKLNVGKAKNDVLDGIRVTSGYLKSGKIKVTPECKGILAEFGLYRWDAKAAKDTVIKENDHAMDDMRYFCYTVLNKEWR